MDSVLLRIEYFQKHKTNVYATELTAVSRAMAQ